MLLVGSLLVMVRCVTRYLFCVVFVYFACIRRVTVCTYVLCVGVLCVCVCVVCA